MDYCLTPINIPNPSKFKEKPKTTIRCLTCKKWPVCNLRSHYLKTAFLIEQILGNPNDDREVFPNDDKCDCGFIGYNFDDAAALFPPTLEVEPPKGIEETTATFVDAKYINKNKIFALYDVARYLVKFEVKWSEEFSRYEFQDGIELYYKLKFKLTSYEFDDAALQEWRQQKEQEEEESKDKDIINTTFFSAVLNCDFYDYDKKLTEDEGWKRIYPHLHGDCGCGCGLYHLLTYHIEPKEVPYLESKFSPNPVLYPVFIPRPPRPPKPYPPRRRDDIND